MTDVEYSYSGDDVQRSERIAILDGETRVLAPTTLPELCQARVLDAPHRTAVIFDGHKVRYAELNVQANRLAHLLISHGIGPGDRVAVAIPRSVELVTALLAVLKAGAAYVPVDPDYPKARVQLLLDDAAPHVVLSTRDTAPLVSDFPQRIEVDAVPTLARLAEQPETSPGDTDRTTPLLPGHPAYVIYTSGSTGRPKGVVIPHNAIVNRLLWMQSEYQLLADDRVLQKTPAGFDVSVWEFFWPLVTGATMVLAQPDGHRDPAYLVRLIRDESVTTAHFVPSMLRAFLQEPGVSDLSSLRRIFSSGEALPADLASLCLDTVDAELHNLYGPTEAAVDVTFWPCTRGTSSSAVPIGRPVWNTRAYVLDDSLRAVAPGEVGELYLSGVQLASGYLGRPALTAERFVPDPNGLPGARMYRTGDLARLDEADRLVFHGRVDHQVKIRGFRIELGEIEAVLAEHPDTGHTAVELREDLPGSPRLTAYVTARPGARLDGSALRAFLAQRLPEPMVPAQVIALEQFPLTSNGKLDRKALPAPEVAVTGGGRGPATPREDILCELFAQELGADQVGAEDSFFALGGDSLVAIRLISRIRSVLGVELGVRSLFRNPTVAALARVLGQAGDARPPIAAGPRPDRLPVSFAQQRLWFLGQLDGPSSTYNIPLAWRLRGHLDVNALYLALRDVVGRHEALRTIFPVAGGQPYQEIVDADAALPVLTVADADPATLRGLMDRAAAHVFDLTAELPVRVWVFRLTPQEQVLVLLTHHIASDGWSQRVLMRDITEAYRARADGREPGWADLPVQYADFTVWQRGLLGEGPDAGGIPTDQVAYWKSALEGLPDQLALPYDHPRPDEPSHRGATVRMDLDARLHGDLLALARAHQSTLFMVLHAGLAALLSRLGAGTDIPIGTPVVGRTDEAVHDLVGLFLNTLVLRADVSGDPSFTELLTRVRETDLAAYAHQDVPFERLVEILHPARSVSRHVLFQVMLVSDNTGARQWRLPGLESESESLEHETSKFDLILSVSPGHAADGSPTGICGVFEYALDLFDEPTVQALGDRLAELLRQAAADPSRPVSGYDVLTAAERERMLGYRNGTGAAVAATLPDLLARRAAATPDPTEARAGASRWSSAELDRRANRLARHLVGLGAVPERSVAIALPRGDAALVAELAVLKAGAAVLPIALGLPAGRAVFMLADAHPAVLVTDSAGAVALEAGNLPVVTLDDPATAAVLAGLPDTELSDGDRPAPLLPGHPAYVVYPADPTEAPTGVTVTRLGIVSRGGPADGMSALTPGEAECGVGDLSEPVPPDPNRRMFVLDGGLGLVPPGVVGELYVAGDGLARGYLHRPDLTAQRFVACPFDTGERMYRTGVPARWRADGTLEPVVRADDPAADFPADVDGRDPVSPREEILCALFAEVLGVERVERADSFFDLGGHSLLAAVLMAKLTERFGVELPLKRFLGAPSVSAVNDYLGR
jgi:amino acid adenylation domain-containing protein